MVLLSHGQNHRHVDINLVHLDKKKSRMHHEKVTKRDIRYDSRLTKSMLILLHSTRIRYSRTLIGGSKRKPCGLSQVNFRSEGCADTRTKTSKLIWLIGRSLDLLAVAGDLRKSQGKNALVAHGLFHTGCLFFLSFFYRPIKSNKGETMRVSRQRKLAEVSHPLTTNQAGGETAQVTDLVMQNNK